MGLKCERTKATQTTQQNKENNMNWKDKRYYTNKVKEIALSTIVGGTFTFLMLFIMVYFS